MVFPIDPTDPLYSPYVGYMGPQNPVADSDYLFTSEEGLAQRWYTRPDGSGFWDELLVPFSSEDPDSAPYVDANSPLGGSGAQYPPFSGIG